MSEGPWLWLLAGPNGAGKTTYAPTLRADIEKVIGPDQIAYELLPTAPDKAAFQAGREALALQRQLLEERRSFAIETTLAGRRYLKLAERAKAGAWNIGIIYIGLGSPDLAIERVRQRKAAGGHDVPVADVRRRYQRGLVNLTAAARLADFLEVLDNSSAALHRVRRTFVPSGSRIKRLLVVYQGKVIFKRPRIPKWLRPTLNAILTKG